MNPSEPEKIGPVVERLHDAGRSLDALVNNAGVVWPLGPTAGLDPGEWSRAITISSRL